MDDLRAGYLPTLANWASMCSAPITPQLKIPLLRLPITPNYLQIHFFQLHPWLICSRLTVSVSKVKRKKNQIPMHRQNYSPETSQLQSSRGHKLTLRTALWHVSCFLEVWETEEFEAAPKKWMCLWHTAPTMSLLLWCDTKQACHPKQTESCKARTEVQSFAI